MGCGGSKSTGFSGSSEANAPTPTEGIRNPHREDNDDDITTVEIQEEKSSPLTSGEALNQEEKLSPREQPDLLVEEEIVQIEKIDEEQIEGNFHTF